MIAMRLVLGFTVQFRVMIAMRLVLGFTVQFRVMIVMRLVLGFTVQFRVMIAIKRHVCGFYEATQRLSCNYTSAESTQFDGRARGDDVMGNLTVSK